MRLLKTLKAFLSSSSASTTLPSTLPSLYTSPSQLYIHHINKEVADLSLSLDFYVNLLGFQLLSTRPSSLVSQGAWLMAPGGAQNQSQNTLNPRIELRLIVSPNDLYR